MLPNEATIVSDDRIPFWRALGTAVHEHDCQCNFQLSQADGSGTSRRSTTRWA